MPMARRRARAIAAVVGTALASVAYAQLSIVSNPATNDQSPPNVTTWMVVSIRNNGTASEEIDAIVAEPALPSGCSAFQAGWSPMTGSLPVTIAPGAQAQFYAPVAAATSPGTCIFDVTTKAGTNDTTFSTDFQVGSGSTPLWQVQPLVNDFGGVALGSSEDQYIFVENLSSGSAGAGYTVQLPAGPFTFQSDCVGMSSCVLSTNIAPGSYHPMLVRCQPTAIGTFSGPVNVYGASVRLGGDSMITCNAGSGMGSGMITVMPKPSLDITTTAGMTGSASAMLDFTGTSDTFVGAAITGADAMYFAFADPVCPGGQTCAPGSPLALPASLGLSCTPPDSTMRSATLTVHGNNGSGDLDSTQLNCIPSAGGPHIRVFPLMVSPPPIAVNQQEGPYPVTVTNTGGSDLVVTGTLIGTAPGDWIADNCIAAPCTIGSGSSTMIGITFAPTDFGNRDAQLELDSNDLADSPTYVDLFGSASGGTLAITTPASGEIDFGTLPRNQLSQKPITAANQGNAPIAVTVAPPNAPFQASTTGFSLAGGAQNTFQAGCMSAVAGSFDDFITLTAPAAYTGSPAQVHVICTVADTDVQVTGIFDFGEVRIHTSPISHDVTITNPTQATVHVTRVAYDASRAGMTLTGGFTSDMALAPGGTITATMTLTPNAEVDLAGLHLDVDVDGVSLSFPITGKVVTPHSTLSPAKLDLGTACIGTTPSGTEMLSNDGTATLTVLQPVLDQNFVATPQSPSMYPALLAPGMQASIAVHPSITGATGNLHGTLTWSDDVPSDYSVDVDVDFIANGAALSPSAVSFGAIAVNQSSPLQEITLQNCDPDPVTVTIIGIDATAGRADAWTIAPGAGYMKVLAAHEKLTIDAQFVPKQRGSYRAKLKLMTNTTGLEVDLSGEATSTSLAATDFYACSCNSHGGAGGWPIALAIFVIVRRRRGSSSPR